MLAAVRAGNKRQFDEFAGAGPSDVDTCLTSAKLDNSSSPAPDARVLMSGIALDCSWAAAAAGMCLWTGDGDLRKTGLSEATRDMSSD